MCAHSSPAPAQRAGSGIILVAAVVLLIAATATTALWLHPGSQIIAGNVPDAIHYTWWLGHTPHAIGNGTSPLQTLDLNWPQGVSAMNNTTLLLPAILLSPLTLLAGPLVTLNVLNVLAVPACAAAGYWAARRVPLGPGDDRLRPAAALVAGTAFAISPAIVNSLVGHITMAFAPGLPVLLALGVALWHERAPVRTGLLLGAVATAQLFTGEEVLFQAAMGTLMVSVVAGLSRPRAVPAAARRLATGLAAAFAVFLPIAAYPLYVQFAGSLKQHGSPFLVGYYGADVASFTTAGSQLLLHTGAGALAATHFPGGIEEHLAYLGWPLLITCLLTAVLAWSQLAVRCAALGMAAAMAFSLGGRIWVNGTWTEHRGPYALLEKLPVTEASLATRFGLLAALFAAALLGVAVNSIGSWSPRPVPGSVLAAALALACLLPLVPRPLQVVPAPAVPSYFSGAARQLPARSVALVLPYPVGSNPVAMRWQSAAGYRFRMPGGYFLGPAADGHAYVDGAAPTLTAQLLTTVTSTGKAPILSQADRTQAAADFAAWGLDRVVLGPDPSADALRLTMTDLLRRAPVRIGGVDVWTPPWSTG